MKKILLSRRELVLSVSSLLVASPAVVLADKISVDIHVVKNAQCGCCDAWVEILADKGFNVTTENRSNKLLTKFKIASGIPKEMMSCHTAMVHGYFIEGHVPIRDIKRLLTERSDALGLAVPGMPYGSPGMGPEEERSAYDVFIIRSNGVPEVFQHYSEPGLLV